MSAWGQQWGEQEQASAWSAAQAVGARTYAGWRRENHPEKEAVAAAIAAGITKWDELRTRFEAAERGQ